MLLCPRRERAAPTTHSTTTMILPFPADSAEFEEYTAAMEEMADLAEASTPDPEPSDMGEEDEEDHWDADPQDEEYWANRDSWDEEPEDRYLDSYWEDQSEYGMQGCCGDF